MTAKQLEQTIRALLAGSLVDAALREQMEQLQRCGNIGTRRPPIAVPLTSYTRPRWRN